MWEEGEFHRNMMKQYEEGQRREAENYNRQQDEQRRQHWADEDRRRREEEQNSNSNQYYSNYNASTSKPKGSSNTFIISLPASPPRSIQSIIVSIICAVVLGGIFGHIFGFFGYIGGAVGGWFLGGIIRNKIFLILVILGALGGGLYMARPYIAPLFSSITGKLIPLPGNATTVINDVNFRTEPSTDGTIIKTLHQGDTVTLTGKVSGGWTQVKHNGDTG
jgi:uncharacterized protein YgiM (DUF1202 family)